MITLKNAMDILLEKYNINEIRISFITENDNSFTFIIVDKADDLVVIEVSRNNGEMHEGQIIVANGIISESFTNDKESIRYLRDNFEFLEDEDLFGDNEDDGFDDIDDMFGKEMTKNNDFESMDDIFGNEDEEDEDDYSGSGCNVSLEDFEDF